MTAPKLVVVLAGGESSEREVSLWTAETVTAALARMGVPYQQIDPRSANWLEHLTKLSPEVVLIALHGPFGEDGQIQAILEKEGIPFTGSGSNAARTAFDKVSAKNMVREIGVKTPAWELATVGSEPTIAPPLVVKPTSEGSSYGVTIAWKQHDIGPAIAVAAQYGAGVMIEKYIAGTEVTCGVIEVFGQLQALPLVEIRPEAEFFDFQAKYDAKYCHEICPAPIAASLTTAIQEQSMQIFKALDCRDYARVDWIINKGVPYFLEINTLPGMTKNSLINKELAAAGIKFDDFLAALLVSTDKKDHNK